MLNGTDWQTTHPQFIGEAQLLLGRCQECVAHLALIANDSDALDCLQNSLSGLADIAGQASADCVARLSGELQRLLGIACMSGDLNEDTLPILEQCLTLLAWQLELIDLRTGQLPLDESEQKELLEKLAICGSARPRHPPAQRLAATQAPR